MKEQEKGAENQPAQNPVFQRLLQEPSGTALAPLNKTRDADKL